MKGKFDIWVTNLSQTVLLTKKRANDDVQSCEKFFRNSEMATGWRHLPETILQLMVIGWNDFPGDSAGLGGWPPCGTILQLAVMGWKAELPWEPRVILSLTFGRVGVRSPVVRPELWPPADLPISALTKPRRKRGECISVESYRCKNMHPVQDSRDNVGKKNLQCEVILFKRINMCVCVPLSTLGSCKMGELERP